MLYGRKLLFVGSLLVFLLSASLDVWAHPWPMFQRTNQHTGRALVAGPDSFENSFTLWIGALSEGAPVVADDGTIYLGTHRGELRAYNPSGSLKWSYPTLGFIRATPLIGPDGTVYVGSQDGGFYAVNPDGTLKWVLFTGEPIASSASLSNDNSTIYFGSEKGKLFALGTDGVMKWQRPVNIIISAPSPTVASDGTIYLGGYGFGAYSKVYAINADGTVKWVFLTPGAIRSTVALGTDGTLYFGSRDGVFHALNSDGSEKWTFKAKDEIRASAAIDPLDGTIYFGSYDNNLYALNPDGTLKWSFATNGFIEASPIIDSRGIIYLKAHSGSLFAINKNGTLKLKQRFQFLASGMALDAKGVLYFCGDFKLFVIGAVPPPPPPPLPDNPEISLSLAKDAYVTGDTMEINATLTNATSTSRVVELKIYMRDSRQSLTSIIDIHKVTLKPGDTFSKVVFTHTFAAGEASTIFYIGARVMVPETGDTVSLDFKTVSFMGQ